MVPFGCSILYSVKGDIGGVLTYSDGFMYIETDNLKLVEGYKFRQFRVVLEGITVNTPSTQPEVAQTEFFLNVHNPCYDRKMVKIDAPEFGQIADYTVLTPPNFYVFDPFKVELVNEKLDMSFCGSLEYVVTINDEPTTINSNPVAFNPEKRKIIIFVAMKSAQGVKSLRIIGRFSNYQDSFDELVRPFNILVDICLYQRPEVVQFPLKDMIQLLGNQPIVQRFNLDKMVVVDE